MSQKDFKPYVPEDSTLAELTVKAVVLGVIMAVVLGAANAYLGMKVGLTVAATFPAAVVAMAALRVFKGTILEENIARTTASVGEALVAGAIFTLPAFVITEVWESIRYFESTLIMLVGGTVGVLFVIVLRRTLVEESDLPFPESVAAAEIVKAGQGGATGAGYVFSAMGAAGLWELLRNDYGFKLVKDSVNGYIEFAQSKIQLLQEEISYKGGMYWQTPEASPALLGVGYIVGFKISVILFAGALFGWLFLVPLGVFLNSSIASVSAITSEADWVTLSNQVWIRQVRPLAVGTMVVAAFYTLWNLRKSLSSGISKAVKDLDLNKSGSGKLSRFQVDLDLKKVTIAIGVLAVPMFFLYWFFSGSLAGSLLLTVIMLVLGFLFAAVAGYLVGLIGSSNNPISGLTLSTLLISAILLVIIGVTGKEGIAAVLGIAGVICCAAAIAGDMMQDLKVGHMLGGTPWRMEVGELIGVVFAALVLAPVLSLMHEVYVIGSAELPAPQAGLMALLSQGIVGGEMSWLLVSAGAFMGVGLIMIGAPAPMLIAVGMYLPFSSTAGIFVGGVIRWLMDKRLASSNASDEQKTKAENTGVLLSSGLIAGQALMAVILAFVVLGRSFGAAPGEEIGALIHIAENPWFGLLLFAGLGYWLIQTPIKSASK